MKMDIRENSVDEKENFYKHDNHHSKEEGEDQPLQNGDSYLVQWQDDTWRK